MISKQKIDFTLKGTESVEPADFSRHPGQFIYGDPTNLHFLDLSTFEQHDFSVKDLAEEVQYLTESLEGIQILIFEEQAAALSRPLWRLVWWCKSRSTWNKGYASRLIPEPENSYRERRGDPFRAAER